MSVVPVCRPFRLHSVSPGLTTHTLMATALHKASRRPAYPPMCVFSVTFASESGCRASPCDHARALDDGEPCQQLVGVVFAADREQVVEATVADVAAGEGL